MTQLFEDQRLSLDVDFHILDVPCVPGSLFEPAIGGVERLRSLRVVLRRDGKELDLTPYLNDRELEDAYDQADELVPDDYAEHERADFDYDQEREAQ